MLNYYFQTHYQRFLLDPILKYVNLRCSPVQITLLAGLIGLLVFPALKLQLPLLATALLLISGFLDTLDGALARKLGATSDWGAALDIIVDRVVELTIILALFSLDPSRRGWVCLLMLGSVLLCMTSFLIVGIFTRNETAKSFYYSPGLMERAEAFIFFCLMIWFPAHINGLAILFICLTLWTALVRVKQFYKQGLVT